MKKKTVRLGNWKISVDTLHWVGFGFVVTAIIALTAYGFSLSMTPNSSTFDSAPESPLALVGVAIANNIGTDLPRMSAIPVELPADVSVVQDALVQDSRDGSFFDEHFTRISELTEILNIDIVNYLSLHTDKTEALEAYIAQLEEKTQESLDAYVALGQLNTMHISARDAQRQNITNVQVQIESAYNNRDGESIMEYVTQLEELHVQEQEHTTIATFALRVGKEYKVLTDLASQKLAVLRANIEPLSKGVTVKLPQGIDIEALRNLRLFTNETN